MTTRELIEEGEALCRLVAPAEQQGLPIYIVPESTLNGQYACGANCAGYTVSILDLMLREKLGERWQGRGAAMILSDTRLLANSADTNEFRTAVLSTAIHEFAHCIQHLPLCDESLIPPAHVPTSARAAELWTALDNPPTWNANVASQRKHFESHGANWLRTVLHFHARASMAGVELPLDKLHSYGSVIPQRHVGLFAAHILDEPERLASWRIADILATPPPPRFTALCAEDRRNFDLIFPTSENFTSATLAHFDRLYPTKPV